MLDNMSILPPILNILV